MIKLLGGAGEGKVADDARVVEAEGGGSGGQIEVLADDVPERLKEGR